MPRTLNDAYLVAAVRTPVGKAPRGAFRTTRPDSLLAHALRSVLARAPSAREIADPARRYSEVRWIDVERTQPPVLELDSARRPGGGDLVAAVAAFESERGAAQEAPGS